MSRAGLIVRPLHALFGAEVEGWEPRDESQETRDAIADAVGRFGLLLFRRAALEDADLARFASGFGPLQNLSGAPNVRREVIAVSNLTEAGTLKGKDDLARMQHDANLLWHMDSSFLDPGATLSFLHARITPRAGADTEFLDARVAWEALAPERRNDLAWRCGVHSMRHSWRRVGVDMPNLDPAALPPVRRKLVRRHAASGRDALLIPSHVETVEGYGYEAGQALLADLLGLAAAPERIYRHQWSVGDLLVWDNRCILHRATPYRAFEEPRDLRSCRVVDVGDDGIVT